MIVHDDAQVSKCGYHAAYYRSSPENQIGKYGFYTRDLLAELFPEMYSNNEIRKSQEDGAYPKYGAVNYKFTFDGPINYAWGNPGNMYCYKCTDYPKNSACQSSEDKSFCTPYIYYANSEYKKNFFTKVCPNLVYDYGGVATVKARLTAPLILVDSAGQMIDKDG